MECDFILSEVIGVTIQQCKYILEIAKCGSFSEAAKHLFIAQSSLSESVKSLENELSVRIFERSKNGVYLTSDGAEFVRYASMIAEQSDLIYDKYNSLKKSKKLYISTQHYDFIADIFGEMVNGIDDESYKFSLRETQTYEVISEVESGYSDIGIIALKDKDYTIMERFLKKKGLVFTPFLKTSPHVFIKKGHPLSKTDKLNYSDLKNYPYVSYEQGKHNSSFFTEEIMEDMNILKHIEIGDRATLMNLLVATDCYTVGTGIMPSALNKGSIVSIPLASKDNYTIGYILRTDRKSSDITEKFIEILNEKAKAFF